MKENTLLLSEFANEEGFELNRYLTHLFDSIATCSSQEDTDFEPALS